MEEQNGCINLAAAVIKQAISDLHFLNSKKPENKAIGCEAYEFLNGTGLDIWCGVLGLSADYIRKEMGKNSNLLQKACSENPCFPRKHVL